MKKLLEENETLSRLLTTSDACPTTRPNLPIYKPKFENFS